MATTRKNTSAVRGQPLRSCSQEIPGETGKSRAAQALADLQEQLGVALGADDKQAIEREQSSERIKRSWIQDGLLVGSVAFGLSWSRSRQALEQSCARGELFSLKVGNRRWYPANLMGLPAEDVKAVCLLLRGVDPVSQFIFWQRNHGSLAGQTLQTALRAGHREAVLRAAEAFAWEHAKRAKVT